LLTATTITVEKKKTLFAVRGFTAAILCAWPPNLIVVLLQTGSIATAQTGILINLSEKKSYTCSKFDLRFCVENCIFFFTLSTEITLVGNEISKIRSEWL
jgi:hypothetical protein